jgi:hypothetical protein
VRVRILRFPGRQSRACCKRWYKTSWRQHSNCRTVSLVLRLLLWTSHCLVGGTCKIPWRTDRRDCLQSWVYLLRYSSWDPDVFRQSIQITFDTGKPFP